MLSALYWYLTILFLGWLSVPVLYRLLPDLPDRGYSIAKIFGLLTWGYLFWILGRLGFTRNDLGGLLFCFILMGGVAGLWLGKGRGRDILQWVKAHWDVILTVEAVFLIAFVGWSLVRALNPEIVGTEKPMELSFINAILRAETFPPHDPWLSGYGISYYYFGYILVAMLAKLTGTLGSVAFNLGVSLIFALSAVGAFGLLYNLLAGRVSNQHKAVLPALLGPLFTLIISNWEGFLHFLHGQGRFWGVNELGQPVSRFWRWMDIQDLVSPPAENPFGHWWWWRASRVIKDYDLMGYGMEFGKEVISEFPFFSYLLADLHPHVLSMPFVFLLLVFGLELYLHPRHQPLRILGKINLWVSPTFFGLLAWLGGSMAFLNTWNFPMYVAVYAGIYALRLREEIPRRSLGETLLDFLGFGAALGILGGVFFLPFFAGFDSQAGGIIPNLVYVTAGRQFWVMFGPLLIPVIGFLVLECWEQRESLQWLQALAVTSVLLFGLLGFMLLLVGLIQILPSFLEIGLIGDGSILQIYLGSIGARDLGDAVEAGLLRRGLYSGTWLSLVLIAFLSLTHLLSRQRREQEPIQIQDRPRRFVFVLIFSGMILVLFPEFFYLRDLFGYRLNTIFKFYYQSWLMWSIAAAYGTVVIFQSMQGLGRLILQILVVLSVVMGLFYPVLSLPDKTNNFSREGGMTLDGGTHFYTYYPSDAQAAQWLRQQPMGVIAEAVGGSYSTAHARMATYTGMPTVLGWDFHEVQWRGGSELVNPRKEDIAQLYCTHNWQTAKEILDRYQIRYVVVGNVERSTYTEGSQYCPNGLIEEKFAEITTVLFQNDTTTIYGYQTEGIQ